MLEVLEVKTGPGDNLLDVTGEVRRVVEKSGVREGVCHVFAPHTTAAVTLNSALDGATAVDLTGEIRRLVPTRVDFAHQYDTPADAAGHVKATLVGGTLSLIVHEGRLLLGGSQSILFFEFDGPRTRRLIIKIVEG